MSQRTVIGLRDPDRRALFLEAQKQTGMVAEMIEKDFWVCWILRHLFELPGAKDHFIFKGGTSLSKVWRVIQRFSEYIAQDVGFWKLTQALNALYPTGTQEERWVDCVLARKKGLGL